MYTECFEDTSVNLHANSKPLGLGFLQHHSSILGEIRTNKRKFFIHKFAQQTFRFVSQISHSFILLRLINTSFMPPNSSFAPRQQFS